MSEWGAPAEGTAGAPHDRLDWLERRRQGVGASEPSLWKLVDDEARRDWLDNRPPKSDERPDPREYEEDRRDRR